jgi:hypothetical protein
MTDQPTLRASLLDRLPPTPVRQEEPSATAVLVRTADALHRLERLAEAMEQAADEGERQLAIIKGRL